MKIVNVLFWASIIPSCFLPIYLFLALDPVSGAWGCLVASVAGVLLFGSLLAAAPREQPFPPPARRPRLT